ncbi:ADP-forming succinate--CoA ligase subunit beta [Desulfallas sp. Bu1-1]|uniref:ADP-forming succinate--CoA ligase subunit beta n=1 Tax=Desulfallas sp. Bu1-1 TaxID=2787620 RepID=UPI00189E19FE|nr:ADP-forming succinate--CoA ligase subunit beta [Desulfallas sp. Bu1-1]MBF7083345.1 ADP-forming succinate--CoA ligase subunit beta [Desulfallas sp. Bu1-1]
MKLFEYMGKSIFSTYGIKVPAGKMVTNPDDAAKAAQEVGGPVVVKSQILTGKRGKGGGIKFADNPEEARQAASDILSMTVQGHKVERILVEEKLQIDKELYLAITVDGAAKKPVIIASAQGGMDIEEVPDDYIVKQHVDVSLGVYPYLGQEISRRLGLAGQISKEFKQLLILLYKIFREKDAELVEINPLVISGDRLIAADSKMTIDDDALFRQKDIPYVEERTSIEKQAHDLGLAFVELGGNIAVMANGAGMSMGSLDTLVHYGGQPANFLDAGGGTGMEGTAKAIELLLQTNPKVIFINIFGGITRCDDVANALVQVKKTRGIPVPVVIRLVGTNEEEGVKILQENGMNAYKVMQEAAAKAVEIANAG